ncbi:MAG: FAD-binding oxidoreductase, partial [Pseudomonadota bacterium]
IEAVWPQGAEIGVPIVGLEPSCLLTLRDEFQVMNLGDRAKRLAENSYLLEEFLEREVAAGRITEPFGTLSKTIHVHTHCHQKAFGADSPVLSLLKRIDGATVTPIESSCCGMAGSFGYQSETYDTSIAMGELSLLPAVRAAGADDLIAADGFSCRHQIADGANRDATHVAIILQRALRNGSAT